MPQRKICPFSMGLALPGKPQPSIMPGPPLRTITIGLDCIGDKCNLWDDIAETCGLWSIWNVLDALYSCVKDKP